MGEWGGYPGPIRATGVVLVLREAPKQEEERGRWGPQRPHLLGPWRKIPGWWEDLKQDFLHCLQDTPPRLEPMLAVGLFLLLPSFETGIIPVCPTRMESNFWILATKTLQPSLQTSALT